MSSFEEYMRVEHKGKENAVKSRQIETRFHCKGTEVRHMVNELRCKGVPICSSRNGYYYAESGDDIRSTIAHLDGRITKIKAAQSGMIEILNKYEDEN